MQHARFLRRTAIGAALATLATVLPPVAAQAAAVTSFSAYGWSGAMDGFSEGSFTWYNRTTYVSGDVYEGDFDGHVTVYFEAFANDTKVGPTEHRTATTYAGLHFGFTIGDTDRPGGINNIRVTVCNEPEHICGNRRRFNRP
ncbi:hypothetical protein [Nucisporomicrobium flavum]|jgi:hypothetical protein|uniref:hypothetical protein n=1 Tax=Nucisporomicrobium flavum TaxID=2785915 RepID=UPI0018F69995|nr:hypothetical protein [Nucisporomicrobium flavum]